MSAASRGAWRRSSYSSASATQNCVEVAFRPDQVSVRDSKNIPGPTLTFPTGTWRTFLTTPR